MLREALGKQDNVPKARGDAAAAVSTACLARSGADVGVSAGGAFSASSTDEDAGSIVVPTVYARSAGAWPMPGRSSQAT